METEDKVVWKESTERITIEFHQPNFMYKREISGEDDVEAVTTAECAQEPGANTNLDADKSGSDESSQEDRMSSLLGGRRRSSVFPHLQTSTEVENRCCILEPSTEIRIVKVVLVASILLSTALFVGANFWEF